MGQPKNTAEEFVKKAEEKHGKGKYDYTEALLEYGKQTKVHLTCNICGYRFLQNPHMHVFGNGCPNCNPFPSSYTTDSYKEKLSETHPHLELMGEYGKDNDDYITVRCKKHDIITKTTPHRISANKFVCRKCYDEHRLSEIREKKSAEFSEFLKHSIYSKKYDTSKVIYVNNRTPVQLICPRHGEFELIPLSMKTKNVGCPFCKESHLERNISIMLDDAKIPYKRWFRDKWLGRLSLDFYLPEYSIAIECQGDQHIDGREDTFMRRDGNMFEDALERDLRKNKLCKEQHITMIYILNKKFLKRSLSEEFQHIYDDALCIDDILDNPNLLINRISGSA